MNASDGEWNLGRIIVIMYSNGQAKNVAYFNSRVQAEQAMYEWITGENNDQERTA
jgi:hypothetical protein